MKKIFTIILAGILAVIFMANFTPAFGIYEEPKVNVYNLPYQAYYWIGVPDPRDLNSVDEIPEGFTLGMDKDITPAHGKYYYLKAFDKCPLETWEGSLVGYGFVADKTDPNGFTYMRNELIIEEIKKDRTTTSFRKTPLKERLRAATEAGIKEMVGKFTDVGAHWGNGYIGKLALLEIVAGYGDGRFGPEDTLKVDEFLKMVLRGMGHLVEEGDKYWAEPYIALAKQEGIIGENEFSDYRRPIRREEAARIVVKAVLTDEYAPIENHTSYVKRKIPDYMEIGDEYKQYVLYSYCFGLITGVGNNVFMPKKNLTRAEGSAIIIRALDENERKPLKPRENETIISNNEIWAVVVYPPLKPEIIDTMRVMKIATAKSKVRTDAGFSYDTGVIGITFFSEEGKRDVPFMSASFSVGTRDWELTNGYDYYEFVVWQPNKVKELHIDSFKEIFNFLFGKEADKAMKEFEYFLSLDNSINNNKRVEKEMVLNGREFCLIKYENTKGFSGSIKIK